MGCRKIRCKTLEALNDRLQRSHPHQNTLIFTPHASLTILLGNTFRPQLRDTIRVK
jgi:hypothetical protein